MPKVSSKSLLGKVSSLAPTKKKKWFDWMTEDQRKELTELKLAHQAGTLKNSAGTHPSLASLHAMVVDHGIRVCMTAFKNWMGDRWA